MTEEDIDAWKCEKCDGTGTHRFDAWGDSPRGQYPITQSEDCDECNATGWCGPDAAVAALQEQAQKNAVEPLPAAADPDSREAQMVVIKRGEDGVPTVWCDPEIVDIVRALNDGGMPTLASCSGHGEKLGNVVLTEGRVLMIFPSLEEFNAAHRKLQTPAAQENSDVG